MIVSASRRTDIPCYYSAWLINRLKSGYVYMRNPMNHRQLYRVNLSADSVDCIVFWTKDSMNIMDKLDVLDKMGYKYYFQFTLNPYDRTTEKNLRNKNDIISSFIQLGEILGSQRVKWRYDPIIINNRYNVEYHISEFSSLCESLCRYTDSVTVSIIDMYKSIANKLEVDKDIDKYLRVCEFVGKKAQECGLKSYACCEKNDLSEFGITKSSCIDKQTIEQICGYVLKTDKDRNQRSGCGCYQSIDIGSYNTCNNSCVYCYANNSKSILEKNLKNYNPDNEILSGKIEKGEKVILKNMSSNMSEQFLLT